MARRRTTFKAKLSNENHSLKEKSKELTFHIGKYKTREGGFAEIKTIEKNEAYCLVGFMIDSNGLEYKYSSWLMNGRYLSKYQEHKFDLIEKLD